MSTERKALYGQEFSDSLTEWVLGGTPLLSWAGSRVQSEYLIVITYWTEHVLWAAAQCTLQGLIIMLLRLHPSSLCLRVEGTSLSSSPIRKAQGA